MIAIRSASDGFCEGAPLDRGGLEPPRDRQTQLALVAGMDVDQTLELGRDGACIDDFGRARGLIGRRQHGATGIAERRRCVTVGLAGLPARPAERAQGRRPDLKSYSTICLMSRAYFLIDGLLPGF
jgi:hypothetical protein